MEDTSSLTAFKTGDLFTLKYKIGEEWKVAPNTPKLREIIAGVGWADSLGQDHFATHWAIVFGIQEDKRLAVITEAQAPADLSKELIALKDAFLIQRILCDETEPSKHLMWALRAKEGLTFYPGYRDLRGEWRLTGRDNCPSFRDYDTTAAVIGVENTESLCVGTMARLRRLIAAEEIVVRAEAPRFRWLLRQKPPHGKLYRHPLFKATVAALSGIPEEIKHPGETLGPEKPYENIR